MPQTMMPKKISTAEFRPEINCNMTLTEYAKFCCTGRLPDRIAQVFQTPSFLKDLLCTVDMVGALEPLAATRPGACDPVINIDRAITVPAATTVDGVVVPAEEKVISFCAPMNRTLVIDKSKLVADNDVASLQPVTQPIYKYVNLATFGEWCLPFEPGNAVGMFVNVEHIIVPPGAGFSIFVQNHNVDDPAIYHYCARMWASC